MSRGHIAKSERAMPEGAYPAPLTLFTLAPHSDEDTSRAAAKAIVPHLERLERRVLRALADVSPMCDRCIQDVASLDGNTERPRRIALQGRGLVQWSGMYCDHAGGKLRRKAKAWLLTDKGREALR